MKVKSIAQRISAVVLFFLTATAGAESRYNMPVGVTSISREVYHLHMLIYWICVGIAVIVFGALIYAMIKFRKSKGAIPAQFHGSTLIEVIWTLIPFVILVAMAIPATIVMAQMYDDSKADINIKIVGFQWRWQYTYLDYDINFFSDLSTPQAQMEGTQPKGEWYLLEVNHPLVVPIHKKIRFLVTSNDVIHAWWVPAFGIKRDAIPGFIHEAWARIDKPGVYRGQCAELCGLHHAYMPIVVIALTENDFDQWAKQHNQNQNLDQAPTVTPSTKPSASETSAPPAGTMTQQQLMTLGETVYDSHCTVCHQPTGEGMPPAFPALKGGPIAIGPVSGHIDIVMHGKASTPMVAFKDQLSDTELASVITFERNSWGNNDTGKYGKQAGGLVQPADITAARQ